MTESKKSKTVTRRVLGGLGSLFGKAVNYIIDGGNENDPNINEKTPEVQIYIYIHKHMQICLSNAPC